tara:strand:+ start:264 stop:704 length:441 start_codon:yes stop_codon:yes gene_type:complete
MKKPKTIFDHLAGITYKKTKWEDLSEADQKSFTPYLINRWLSMSPDLIEIVDMFQHYTIGPLSKEHVYKLYYDILPKGKFFSKYIKGKKLNKYNTDLVKFIAEHGQTSKREAMEYIDHCKRDHIDELKSMLKKYGKTEKEIKQWIK